MNQPDTHGKGVDVLVHKIQESDRLDNVVVVLLDRELYLGARVGVAESELSTGEITGLQGGEKLVAVETETTEEVLDDLVGLAVDEREGGLDGTGQVLVGDSEDDLLLLAALGKVGLKETKKVLTRDTLRNVVRVLERLGGTPGKESAMIATASRRACARNRNVLEGQKGDQADHLSELGQIIGGFLDFLEAVANGIRLLDDLVKAVSDGGLLEEVIDGRHDGRVVGESGTGGGCGYVLWSRREREIETDETFGDGKFERCGPKCAST